MPRTSRMRAIGSAGVGAAQSRRSAVRPCRRPADRPWRRRGSGGARCLTSSRSGPSDAARLRVRRAQSGPRERPRDSDGRDNRGALGPCTEAATGSVGSPLRLRFVRSADSASSPGCRRDPEEQARPSQETKVLDAAPVWLGQDADAKPRRARMRAIKTGQTPDGRHRRRQ